MEWDELDVGVGSSRGEHPAKAVATTAAMAATRNRHPWRAIGCRELISDPFVRPGCEYPAAEASTTISHQLQSIHC